MKTFKQLQEEVKKSDGIVFSLGRFQPPTIGHQLVMDKVKYLADKYRYDNMVYTTQTHDNKKNPLEWRDKVSILEEMFPKNNISHDTSIKNPWNVIDKLYEQNYKHVILVVGSDRVQEFKSSMAKYVKDFESFKVESAGTRNNSSGAAGASGTKMREFVLKNDYISFSAGLPKNYRNGKKLFDKLQKGLK